MIQNALRVALRINSGKKIFIFGIAERLRALRYPIFTGGVSPCPGGNYLTLRPNNAILGLKLPLVADGLVTER